jgi:predicted metal-dependent HD superfamily phosphohydrolase
VDAVDAAFAALVARYDEPHRRYHTLEHVIEGLDAAAARDGGVEVALAVWFHDAIYDPTVPGNEAASAVLARDELRALDAPEPLVDEVVRLVELSATHAVAPGDRNGRILVDADLSILAAAPDRYDRYARDVRAEYAHVDDDGWRAGRVAVLRSLLARVTDDAARSNIRRELAGLVPQA